jgi:hypothetical protein
MKHTKSILILLFSLFFLKVGAQPGKPGGTVQDQSQDVIKNFDAKLLESEKVKINPVLPAVDTATKAQTYNVPNKVLAVDYQPPRMRPIQFPGQKLPPQYNGYAKVGYGFPNAPYGEAAYRFGDPKQYLAGISLKHHSQQDKKIENQRFSYTGGEVNGTFFTPVNIAVDGKIGFVNDGHSYYGYNALSDTISRSKESVKQFFNTFSAAAKAYNSARTVADFNYSLGLNFDRIIDNYSSREIDFDAKLEATKWFNEKHPLSMTIRTDFTTYDSVNAGKSQSLNNIYLQPSFTYKGNNFSIRIGGNLISHEDEFFPKPDVELNLNLAGTTLGIFAGAKGDFIKNNFKNITNYNPYIFSKTKIENTNKNEYYGGIKGNISGFDYSAQAGWSSNKNLALFLSDSTDVLRRFNVLYDDVNIFNIRGAIKFFAGKQMEVTGTVSQNIYTAQKEKAAWGLPSLDVNIGAKYNLEVDPKNNTTAAIKASLFAQNGVNFKDKTGEAARLNALVDLSIGGELFFTKNIGVFLDVNNLLNQKRQRWENYPTFGMNILGGISARF